MRMQTALRILWFLLVAPNLLSQCVPTAYRVVENWSGSGRLGSLYISLPSTGFTVHNLTCLSKSLRASYPDWQDATVAIFSSAKAAGSFTAAPAETSREFWLKSARPLHALYILHKEKGEEYIEILPLGLGSDESLSSKISISEASSVRCKLELNARCITILPQDIAIGPTNPAFNTPLRIRLHATVRADGSVKQVSSALNDPPTNHLARRYLTAAAKNLRRWQFDTGSSDIAMDVIYLFDAKKSTASVEIADTTIPLCPNEACPSPKTDARIQEQ